MYRLKRLVFTSLLAMLALSPAAMARPPATPATTDRPAQVIGKLLQAMQRGDESAAMAIYRQSTQPSVHIWAAMVLERIHFHLDAATRDARLCEKNLLDGNPGIALLCGKFESGNLRLAGKYSEANDLERTLMERFGTLKVGNGLDDIRWYLNAQGDAPALRYEPGDNSLVSVPLKQPWTPTFEANGNGHAFELEIDTGANGVVLGTQQAKALGVRLLSRTSTTSGWLSHNVSMQRGLLDTLSFGGITLRHVPVAIVAQPIALIGANLIAPLGVIRINHQTLSIDSDASKASTCGTQMLTGTNLWGTSLRLLPKMLVNGTPEQVMLDTGAGRYLLGTRAALDEVELLHRGKVPLGDIGGVHPFASARSAKVILTVAGQPIEIYFIVLTQSTMQHAITLGAGALRDMDFLLDFRHGTQCFVLHPNLH